MCEHKRKTPKRIENKWSPSTGAAKRKLHAFESGLKEKLTMTGTKKKKNKNRRQDKTEEEKKQNTNTKWDCDSTVCRVEREEKGLGKTGFRD